MQNRRKPPTRLSHVYLCPGFIVVSACSLFRKQTGVTVGDNGLMDCQLQFRHNGRLQRQTGGRVQELSLTERTHAVRRRWAAKYDC